MKRAISLIELIVSILIVGLVMSTIPLMLFQTNDNNALSLRQDAILAAKTKLWEVLSYDWDENSYEQNHKQTYIINTANANLNDRNGTVKNNTTILSGRRRTSPTNAIATSTLGKEGGTYNDIDDFDNDVVKLAKGSTGLDDAKSLDYIFKDTMSQTLHVKYIKDTKSVVNFDKTDISFNFGKATSSTTSNIKLISIDTQTSPTDTITLSAYSCNIGESKPLIPRSFEP